MNTRFLLSPAYLISITLMVTGTVLSGTRLMLVGWIIFIVSVFLNAMTLVILTNRDQLQYIRQEYTPGHKTTEPFSKRTPVAADSAQGQSSNNTEAATATGEDASANDETAVAKTHHAGQKDKKKPQAHTQQKKTQQKKTQHREEPNTATDKTQKPVVQALVERDDLEKPKQHSAIKKKANSSRLKNNKKKRKGSKKSRKKSRR